MKRKLPARTKHIYDNRVLCKINADGMGGRIAVDKDKVEVNRKKAEEFIAALEEELLNLDARYVEVDYIGTSEDERCYLRKAIYAAKVSFHRDGRFSWPRVLRDLDKNALTNLIARLDLDVDDPDCYYYEGLTADEWLDNYGDYDDCDPEERLYWAGVEADDDRRHYQALWDELREDDRKTLARLRELQASLIEE